MLVSVDGWWGKREVVGRKSEEKKSGEIQNISFTCNDVLRS